MGYPYPYWASFSGDLYGISLSLFGFITRVFIGDIPILIGLHYKGFIWDIPILIGLHYKGIYMGYPYIPILIGLHYKGIYMGYPYPYWVSFSGDL